MVRTGRSCPLPGGRLPFQDPHQLGWRRSELRGRQLEIQLVVVQYVQEF